MRNAQAGNSTELRPHAHSRKMEHQSCESIREVFQALHPSAWRSFTPAWLDTLWSHLNDVIHHLDRLPEDTFREMIEVIDGLGMARAELGLACFLFDVEEIDPVHRLLLRNRAVWRSENILQKVLQAWPSRPS